MGSKSAVGLEYKRLVNFGSRLWSLSEMLKYNYQADSFRAGTEAKGNHLDLSLQGTHFLQGTHQGPGVLSPSRF